MNIQVPNKELAAFCRRHHIRRLAFFGSVLRDDFTPDSDVDVLVEFGLVGPGSVPGLFGLARMERELAAPLGERKVDLPTPEDLSRYFRQTVSMTVDGVPVEIVPGNLYTGAIVLTVN